MIVDTSAIIAILFDEPEGKTFFDLIEHSSMPSIGAPTLLETTIVAQSRKRGDILQKLDRLISALKIEVVDFGEIHAATARHAFLKFGKGQNNNAQLNFADCMSYAMSKVEGMPLLFKGDDFRHTDVEAAV